MPPITADLVRLMREASGLGMMDCKRAAEMAQAELDGDYVLALLAVDAHGLAVAIRSRDPNITDAEARRRWDLAHAAGRRDEMAGRTDAWRQLNALSGRWKGSPEP